MRWDITARRHARSMALHQITETSHLVVNTLRTYRDIQQVSELALRQTCGLSCGCG